MNFFIHRVTRALVGRHSHVRVTPQLWHDLVQELGARSGGVREAGAFLLADNDCPKTVCRVVYFDDVDPACLTGAISMHASGLDRLWIICADEGRRVIADVHTHPGGAVHQSDIDAANPMIATAGHVAIIVPHLASRPIDVDECGVHVYRGAHRWEAALGRTAAHRLYVGRWA